MEINLGKCVIMMEITPRELWHGAIHLRKIVIVLRIRFLSSCNNDFSEECKEDKPKTSALLFHHSPS